MIFSMDLVAADAVGTKCRGKDPRSIRHIRLAQDASLGVADLDKIRVEVIDFR